MKKRTMKLLSLCLCAALAVCGAGGAVRAAAANGGGEAAPVPDEAPLPARSGENSPVKDETVYVLAGADGKVEKVIVSDWLKNTAGSAVLTDPASLSDVVNVKGGEGFTLDANGSRVWDARGGDVYSQGLSGQAPPVELAVSYTLDGRTVSPEELAGKSGRVSIRFTYTNNQYELAEIGGQREKICVPFAVLTGVLLDNEVFANVEAVNGRVYSDGERTAVAGMAFPGLQESLAVDAEKLEIPDYVEITADVTGFRLENTFTVAVSDIFGEIDVDRLGAGGLEQSLDELTGAMEQLTDGSGRLYDGLCALLESAGALAEGVDSLTEGAGALTEGGADLEDGAARLQDGAESLSQGLDALAGGSETLTGGAAQVFDTLLAAANSQLAAGGAEVPELTADNYARVLDGVLAALDGSPAAAQVSALKQSLDSYNAFYQGLCRYTGGVAEAAAGAQALTGGAAQLRQGAASLEDGAARLQDGLAALRSGMPALTEGVTRLRDGALDLSDGLDRLDREGVRKLTDAADGGLAGLTERVRAVAGAAERYRSFSGLGEGMDGRVKFIYRTAAIDPD